MVGVLKQKGVPIYAPLTVTDFDAKSSSSEVTLSTDQGKRIHASHVVVATNSPINDVATIHTKQAAYRTYAVAFEAAEAEPTLAWDMEDPYHYVRYARDAVTRRPVLIVGGEDHRVDKIRRPTKIFLAWRLGRASVFRPRGAPFVSGLAKCSSRVTAWHSSERTRARTVCSS